MDTDTQKRSTESKVLITTIVFVVLVAVLVPFRDKLMSSFKSAGSSSGAIDDSETEMDSTAIQKRSEGVKDPISEAWLEFQKKYGPNLVGRFTSTGRLLEVRGGVNVAKKSDSLFKVDHAGMAIERAKQMLDDSTLLMNLQPQMPVLNPVSRPDRESVMVEFQETYEGTPVEPYGKIQFLMGPKGELLSLKSTYISKFEITNEKKFSVLEAKSRAATSVTGEKDPGLAQGGQEVLWVTNRSKTSQVKYAFDFNVQGYRVVVDASNLVVLQKEKINTD